MNIVHLLSLLLSPQGIPMSLKGINHQNIAPKCMKRFNLISNESSSIEYVSIELQTQTSNKIG